MISVIIPVYNVEKYLAECLDSVLAQTYSDWEAILVDDGSTDSSPAICAEYARLDPRIRMVRQENQGLSGARNTGIEISTGDHITFLDSDDALVPGALELLATLSAENDADMAVCPMLRLEEDGSMAPYKNHAPIHGTEIYTGDDKMASYLRLNKQTNTACGKLYARRLFDEIRFPAGKISEDVFTGYRVIHAAQRIVIHETPLYIYRNRPGSIMTRRITSRDFDVIEGRVQEQEFIQTHYPDLAPLMPVKICSAAVTLVIRTAADRFSDPEKDALLRRAVRENLKPFLKSRQGSTRKFWAVLSACSLGAARLGVRAYRALRRG